MNEEFEYKGEWWLPDAPKDKTPGTLKFSPDKGGILELVNVSCSSPIEGIGNLLKGEYSEEEIILGRVHDGKSFKDVTLYRCLSAYSSLSLGGYGFVILVRPNIIFVGTHFKKPDDIKFKRASAHYSLLSEWLRPSLEPITDNKINDLFTMPELLRPLPIVESTLSGNCKIAIRNLWGGLSRRGEDQIEISIKGKPYLELELSEEKPFLEEYQRIDRYLRTFFSFWISEPIYSLDAKVKIHNDWIDVHYKQTTTKSIFPHKELCSFKDISENLGTYLEKWFKQVETLEDVHNLYFGTLYNPQMPIHQIFLSLVFAIELYHRIKYGGQYLSDNEYKQEGGLYQHFVNHINSIPFKIDNEFKESLQNKMEYFHEYSFRKRLKEILQKHKYVTASLISDSNRFINETVNTRNDLVHKGKTVKDAKELYDMSIALKTLLEICLLSELGMDETTINNIVLQSRRTS